MTQTCFSQLPLAQSLLEGVAALGFERMTPIQSQALPIALSGRDLIGQAKTGSGKTVAFALGLLHRLQVERYRVQALVLCPTRELADQVAREIRRLARQMHNVKVLTLCGGTPMGPQIASLEHGAHIIVGTPGRVDDHIRKGRLDLSEVATLVLDEADRMLDMGFAETLEAIVATTPDARQTLLFSATFPRDIASLSERYLRTPARVSVDEPGDAHTIEQHFYSLNGLARAQAVERLLLHLRPERCVVFCNTKRDVKAMAQTLEAVGFKVGALHGDLEQRERDITLALFASHSLSVLVATDVAARGLDISGLDMVINADMARESEVHVHRVGRTGRAGRKGLALSLVDERETHKFERLCDYSGLDANLESLPDLAAGVTAFRPPMVTLQLDGGRKQKVRPGDILGALTGADGVAGEDVGKIHVFDFSACVAVRRKVVDEALEKIRRDGLKGRRFRVRRIS
ncbi:ATP-dependent RNA helicase DbpA [Gilvimarinus algae]|uniref:ATP-dependent RNA helicase DbpA n=1 Tax=Gilvimarinus algae TaxID=3058037 RepID=A0ABT8TFQ2_9GAMM|nr:ATP-dependent RNA helicase DbpA [Gilvimarinus sp. SDUM040014]MDO3382344.1 ATP-dependent RNA helicase DbpA [Gilvimarinus sp. SDUM040014]